MKSIAEVDSFVAQMIMAYCNSDITTVRHSQALQDFLTFDCYVEINTILSNASRILESTIDNWSIFSEYVDNADSMLLLSAEEIEASREGLSYATLLRAYKICRYHINRNNDIHQPYLSGVICMIANIIGKLCYAFKIDYVVEGRLVLAAGLTDLGIVATVQKGK